MTDQVWIKVSEVASIGVDRDKAMTLDHAGFVALYKRVVYPPPGYRARLAWKRDAHEWAAKQIRDREASLAAVDG